MTLNHGPPAVRIAAGWGLQVPGARWADRGRYLNPDGGSLSGWCTSSPRITRLVLNSALAGLKNGALYGPRGARLHPGLRHHRADQLRPRADLFMLGTLFSAWNDHGRPLQPGSAASVTGWLGFVATIVSAMAFCWPHQTWRSRFFAYRRLRRAPKLRSAHHRCRHELQSCSWVGLRWNGLAAAQRLAEHAARRGNFTNRWGGLRLQPVSW